MLRCFTDRPKNVHEMLSNAVARRPQGVALVSGEETRLPIPNWMVWSPASPAV